MKTRFTRKARRLAACWQWGLALLLGGSVGTGVQAQNPGSVTTTQSFSYTGQIETWTVPSGVTSLTIEARGAEGGDVVGRRATAGKGAIVAARVDVTPGQSLSILVGQSLNGRSAGGGGAFVAAPGSEGNPTALVVAGGGGGASTINGNSEAKHGQLATSGGTGGFAFSGNNNNPGSGGTNANGGGSGANGAGGGGGFTGNGGGMTTYPNAGGRSFTNGGAGGSGASVGSYGGGGSSDEGVTSGGGGGGYSGGGAGYTGVGGGGGSFTAGTRLFARTGDTDGNSGNGLVIISYTPSPTISNFKASSNLVCLGDPVYISATVGNVSGTVSSIFTETTSGVRYAGSYINNTVGIGLVYDSPGQRNFTVQVTSNGQEASASGVSFTVVSRPTAYDVNGGGAYCQGGSGVVVNLSSSQMGVSYQLLRNGNSMGSALAGTGSELSFGSQTVGGTYTVLATNISTSCQQTMNGSVTVTVNTPPTVSITPSSTAICAGQTATFTASGDPASYSWSSGQTSAMISASIQGAYSVTATSTSNGCSSTATATLTVNEKPVPPTTQPVTVCQNSTPVSLATGITSGSNLRWYTRSTGGTGSSTAPTPPTSTTGSTTYYVSQLNSSNCESERVSITYTVNPLPTPSITGLATAYCKDAAAVTLMGSPAAGARGVFTVDGTTATVFNPASLSVGQHTVVYSYTNASGCLATASQMVTVKEVPQTPSITTQPNGPYPSGQSNLTISQNTGNVILGVSGCTGGMITWSGGASNTLSVSTASTGTQTFTATCTTNGCTSPVGIATVTVVAPTLKVLSRDPDNGQLNNNTIKPYLLLQNAGTTPIDYSTITLRYWLTTENNIPLNFQKNYVGIGQNNLNLRYVPLATLRQGATGYIEYSFNGGAGSLAPNGDSGPLEVQATKQDYSRFVQSDDYSYINNSAFTLNARITAYQNGVIFYGQEPTGTGSARTFVEEVATLLQVKVLGNPVVGQSAEVEISGVNGQAVQLKLVDLQGKTLHGQSIKEAGSVERVSLPLGNAQGILLLEVSTITQRQQIKLLRP